MIALKLNKRRPYVVEVITTDGIREFHSGSIQYSPIKSGELKTYQLVLDNGAICPVEMKKSFPVKVRDKLTRGFYVLQVGVREYTVIDPAIVSSSGEIDIKEEFIRWITNQINLLKTEVNPPGFLEKYGQKIIPIAFVAAAMVFSILLIQYSISASSQILNSAGSMVSGVAKPMAEISRNIAAIAKELGINASMVK